MSIARRIAEFATGPIAPDAEMARYVRMSLLDWATVGIAGRDEPVSRAARAVALAEGGDGATLIGGGRAAPRAAALANGAISHALDYDDTHFGHIGHPSVAVIPAALAVAEAREFDGAAFLDALAVGLETACRIGDWLGRSHYEAGFHQTGTSGAFGACVAAGRLLGLDADAMTHALGLTATRASGLKSQFGTMGKPLNAGLAAEAGVTCALLAGAGAHSSEMAIEGSQGFGPTHAAAMQEAAWAGLGERWVFKGISYKFHACCHGLHAMLEALRSLGPIDPAQVEEIEITTHPRWLAVCNQPAPETGLGAKFSYRVTASMQLLRIDTAALDSYSDATCARPDLIALRDKVRVVTDEGLADTASRVRLRAAGEVHEASHDILDAGDTNGIADRLREKSESLLGARAARQLSDEVSGMESATGVSGFTVLFAQH
jgi:2-methylcitrate dehydratase PrpD